MLVNSKTAVAVAVKGKADVKMLFTNKLYKIFKVCRTAASINVKSIGLSSKCTENCARNRPRCTVGTVKTDAELFLRIRGNGNKVTDISVSTAYVVLN